MKGDITDRLQNHLGSLGRVIEFLPCNFEDTRKPRYATVRMSAPSDFIKSFFGYIEGALTPTNGYNVRFQHEEIPDAPGTYKVEIIPSDTIKNSRDLREMTNHTLLAFCRAIKQVKMKK